MTGRTLGRYQLGERLGRGGMGEVWRARDPALRRDVAVKVLRRDGVDKDETLRDDFVQRFLREARAAASLKHPNVVAIHDIGVDEEPYIVMEWVEGASLRGFIGDASVPVARRIEWLVEIARALAAAHELGLVHRDIKPDNVMITKDGHAKVLDFGIAKVLGATEDVPVSQKDAGPESFRTQQGRIVGTPKYMAPEQLRGDPIDARVDQWAWACVAYELLTGSMPDRDEIPQPISLTMPEVPFDVAAAIVRARSIDRDKRFDSMRALLAAFAVQPSGEVTISSPSPKRDPDAPTTTGPVRRSRLRVALVALGSFALAGVGVLAYTRAHPKQTHAIAAPPPPPACKLTELPTVSSLGASTMQFMAIAEPQVAGLTFASVRVGAEQRYAVQLVMITRESAAPRMAGEDVVAHGTPISVFVIPSPETRYFTVQTQTQDSIVVSGRNISNDAIVSLDRISPVGDFKPRNVSGVLAPHTNAVAYLVLGATTDAKGDRQSGLRLYGKHASGRVVYDAPVGQLIAYVQAASNDHAIAYTFTVDGELHVGAFDLVERVEQQREPLDMIGQVAFAEIVDAKPATVIGKARARANIAFQGDDIHVVWSDPTEPRIHHATFRAGADAGIAHEAIDAQTSGLSVDVRITNGVFSLAWFDGARIWYGEGDGVASAVRRATSLPDSMVAAGPWVARGNGDALVAWIGGANNDVRRAIVTCR